uniref:Uncharacterized protein n=1 Tax=Anguilla anguilla TaxID=7936 RepID=A0A0E9UVP8_ANGAN
MVTQEPFVRQKPEQVYDIQTVGNGFK